MAFKFWHTKSGQQDAPVIVACRLPASLRYSLSQVAAQFHLQVLDHLPKNDYYILVLAPGQSKPLDIPAHIPAIQINSPDLPAQIAQALLYLQAHHDIKQ